MWSTDSYFQTLHFVLLVQAQRGVCRNSPHLHYTEVQHELAAAALLEVRSL